MSPRTEDDAPLAPVHHPKLDPLGRLYLDFESHGDPAAFRDLYRRLRKRTLPTARRLLGSAADAEDVVQHTFVQLLRGKYQPCGPLLAWFRRTVRNTALSMLRLRRPAADVIDELMGTDDPSRCLRRREIASEIRRSFSRLTPAQATVAEVRFLDGVDSYDEIAIRVGLKPETIPGRLLRARRSLRTSLRHLVED